MSLFCKCGTEIKDDDIFNVHGLETCEKCFFVFLLARTEEFDRKLIVLENRLTRKIKYGTVETGVIFTDRNRIHRGNCHRTDSNRI